MPVAFRRALSLLLLGLSLITSAHAQSANNSPVSSEVGDLAVSLARLKSKEEQDLLLNRNRSFDNASLLIALKALSDPLVQKGQYNEAIRISELAIRVAETMDDRIRLATALCDLGAIYARRNPSREAFPYLEKSLTLFEEAGEKKGQARVMLAIAVAYNTERRFELGVEYYEKSLAISREMGEQELTARALNGLGLAHSSLGRYELGLEFYQQARALSEEINDKDTLNIALNNIATYYTARARYSEALDYLHKSLKLLEELGPESDRRSLAYKLQNIGLIYRRQGRHDQALAYARRSLEIFLSIDDKFGIANLRNNIGVIYKAQGLYDEGLEWFQEALQGFQAIRAMPGVARSLNNIGDTYRLQGRYDDALATLQKSLQIREQIRDLGGVSLSLNNLGRLYQDQGKYSEMLEVSRRAARHAEELNSWEELWEAQERVGRALFALGQPEEARRSFLDSISTVEAMRRQVAGGEQQQQSFLENRLSPWLGMVDLLVSQEKYREALTFAERSKARVLLDALSGDRVKLRQSWTKEEQEADERKRLELVSLNSQLTSELRREKPDEAQVAKLRASVTRARLDYEDFETRLYVTHPELRLQRGEAPIIKADEIDSLLRTEASALLEYVVGEDKTYLFVVTKGKSQADVRVYTLPVKRDELAQLIESFRRQLSARDLGFRAPAAKLYDLLIKPAAAQLRGRTSLIIAPDNTLWDLPFQALRSERSRFLIEEAAIGYTPSLTVLREMTKRQRNRNSDPASLLALGNPAVGNETIKRVAVNLRDGKLEPLPEAEEEVKALRKLYGASRSTVYVGADAREDRVKREAGRARILHFATHGILNNAAPMYSHLALAEGGEGEDGLLEAWELMQLDLQADLVVLSACETARGRFGAGEGMIGLSWAMFIAGVPSLVVSQWKVESAGTRDLMVNFHHGLVSKPQLTKAEALREAALKLMKNPETSHPFYWAGFVLVGDSR